MDLRILHRRAYQLGVILCFLWACHYDPHQSGGIDNPVYRKLAWFSYLDGSDIRDGCVAGSPVRYRLIYNGQYEKQVRSYEISATGAGATLLARSASGLGTLNFTLGSPSDIFGPWRWRTARVTLTPEEYRDFRALLAQSGFHDGAPNGKRLYSRDYYWVAQGCEDGRYYFNAWVHAQGDFTRVRFSNFLLAHDQTGDAFRPPRPVSAAEREERLNPQNRSSDPIFVLTVRDNGIGGVTR
ncbi:MAG TPA: hypothetical protein VHL08_05050 [Dongiaceae bacterium]|jgi:hypothetical protein|nr:hypothetical protein [Dongiaceae bacterium]